MGVAIFIVLAAVLVVAIPAVGRHIGWAARTIAVGYAALGIAGLLVFRGDVGNPIDYDSIHYFESLNWVVVLGTFSVAAMAVYLGAVLVRLAQPTALIRPVPTRLQLTLSTPALLVAGAIIAAEIAGIGLSTVLYAPQYLAATGPVALYKIGSALAPLAAVIAAAVMFGSPHRGARRMGAVLLALVALVAFAKGSRTFALIPLLAVLGGWLAGRWTGRRVLVRFLAGAGAAFLLLGVPLALRFDAQGGLIPNGAVLFTNPGSFFTGRANPLANAFLGAPIAMYVGALPPMSTRAFLVAINPMPGTSTDWSAIAPTQRLYAFEPYSTLGELIARGLPTLVVYCLIIGAVFETLTIIARTTSGRAAAVGEAIVVGIAALFLIRSTQYDLRTATRLVYYAIVGVAGLAAASHVVSVRKTRRARSLALGHGNPKSREGHAL